MAKHKKLNELESEKVAGGKCDYDPQETFEYNGKMYYSAAYFVCENCGKLIENGPKQKCIWDDVDYETGAITKRYVCEMCWDKLFKAKHGGY
ncbi:MAG: hypothetical protein Q4D57_06025 [Clostridia bacterium]|nr:hypothetical protein [Clostridia bacterium]